MENNNNTSPGWKTGLKEAVKVVTLAAALSGPANVEANPMIDMIQGCKGQIGALLGDTTLHSNIKERLKKGIENTQITSDQVSQVVEVCKKGQPNQEQAEAIVGVLEGSQTSDIKETLSEEDRIYWEKEKRRLHPSIIRPIEKLGRVNRSISIMREQDERKKEEDKKRKTQRLVRGKYYNIQKIK